MSELISPDLFIPTLCAWRETRSIPAAYPAVFWVIRNRANDEFKRWPTNPTDVCLQRWQFSCFNANDPQTGKYPTPSIPVSWKQFKNAAYHANLVFDNAIPDPTAGANHYYDNSIPPPAAAWLGPGATREELDKFFTLEIGTLKFYNIPPRRKK